VKNLLDFAGMDSLRAILDSQFFSRSRIMRCHATLLTCKNILKEILDYKFPMLKKTMNYRGPIIDWINHSDFCFVNDKDERKEIHDLLKSIVEKNFYSPSTVKALLIEAESVNSEIESMLDSIEEPNIKSKGLLRLELNKSLFSDVEISDLEIIFGRNGDRNDLSYDCLDQLRIKWMLKVEGCLTTQDGRKRKEIFELAIESCNRLMDKYEDNK